MPPVTAYCLPLLACAVAAVSAAQEQLGEPRWLGEPPATAAASAPGAPFQPANVSSRLRRALMQYEALVADAAWDEAIELVETLQAEHGGEIAPAADADNDSDLNPLVDPDGHDRFVTIAARCQQLLAGLPPEGREAYLGRVGSTSRRLATDGAAQLDAERLRTVSSEFFATPACRDALLALGELALERGDTVAARRAYAQLTDLAWGPYGRPAGVTLAQIDPRASPEALATAWTEAARPSDLMTIPNPASAETDFVADALARLALVSLREGDLARAAAETRLLEAIAPGAEGRIAGRRQPLAVALHSLAETADASNPEPLGGAKLRWAWSTPVPYDPNEPSIQANAGRIHPLFAHQLMRVGRWPPNQRLANGAEPAPTMQAVANEHYAFYVSGGVLTQVELASGETARVDIPGVEYAEPADETQPRVDALAARGAIGPNAVIRGQVFINGRLVQVGQRGVVPPTARSSRFRVDPNLTLHDGVLYVRVSEQTFINPRARVPQLFSDRLVGLDLSEEGRVAVEIKPPETPAQQDNPAPSAFEFAGPPALRGEELYVAQVRRGLRSEFELACYDINTGRERWRTEIGSGEPTQRRFGPSDATTPVLLSGDTLYVATDEGAVAALSAADGAVRWLARYPRRPDSVVGSAAESRPPFLAGDRLVVAPADAAIVMAYDTGTGRPVWQVDRLDRDARLVGVEQGPQGRHVAVVAGRRVVAYDTLTGETRFAWPESLHAGLRGQGRAVISSGELFWPTRTAVYSLDPVDGAPTRTPLDLASLGAQGASVCVVPGGLIVAGPDHFQLLSPPRREPTDTTTRLKQPTAARVAERARTP